MSTSSPLVSIIISAYNHENYVQDTIHSLINQTYKNIELLIIDDGSTDDTWKKIQETIDICNKRFVSVYFVTQENKGTCTTLNKLLDLAQGKYIYFIASDDISKSYAIEKQVEFLEKNPDYALVVGNNDIIDSTGNICYWDIHRNNVYSKEKARYFSFVDYLERNRNFKFTSSSFGTYGTLHIGNYIPNGYLIKKSIFEKTGYFTNEAPLEDWYLMLQISKYAKMKYLDEILYSYRWHETNTIINFKKIKNISNKTMEHELFILNNIDKSKVLPDIIDIKKNGYCYKKQGIPNIFQILTYRKFDKKIKIIKFFNKITFTISRTID